MSEELLCPICGKSVQSVNHTPDCQHTLKEILDYSHALRKQLEEQSHNLDIAIGQNEIIDAQLEAAQDAIYEVENWAKAYPLDMFPEPDFKRARELLEAGGIKLDSISASNMRHVIKGVERIVGNALTKIERIRKEAGNAEP